MKLIKNTLLSSFLVLFALTLSGQTTIVFGYDAAGNRIGRTISLNKSALIDSTQTQDEFGNNMNSSKKNIHQDQVGNITFFIYPNPTQGMIEISALEASEISGGEILVYDIQGNTVMQEVWNTGKTQIDMSNLATGTYFIKFFAADMVREWKIIKE